MVEPGSMAWLWSDVPMWSLLVAVLTHPAVWSEKAEAWLARLTPWKKKGSDSS